MEEVYNGNGVWIPYEVLQSKELTSTEKILYAEIYYLDRPDIHCTASNEHLAEFLCISEAGVKKCLQHLRELGYIYTASFNGRNRSIATYVKWRNEVDTGVSSREIQEYPSEVYKNEFLLIRENKKENSKESTGAGASSKNHSQVYKQRNTLSDDLESGKDIDEQKKFKKQSPKDKFRDECLDIIDDEYSEKNYSYTVKDLLVEYFEFVSAVPEDKDNLCKRVKTVKAWKHKLDKLDALVKEGYDPIDIIQQSLDNKAYVFYPLQSAQSKSTVHREGNQENVVMSDPEYMRKRLEEDESEEWY